MTYNFPIQITEIPHRGEVKTWTLYDADHLSKCIEGAERSGYTDWQIQEGNIEFIEGEDGEFQQIDKGAFTLDAYLDWLRDDLRGLEVEEV